jgi:hypothetical protein
MWSPAATNCRGGEKHRQKYDPHRPDGDMLYSSDLLLKHTDTTLATSRKRQMKHLKHVSETHAKTFEKHLKTIAKHMQDPDKTLATYM